MQREDSVCWKSQAEGREAGLIYREALTHKESETGVKPEIEKVTKPKHVSIGCSTRVSSFTGKRTRKGVEDVEPPERHSLRLTSCSRLRYEFSNQQKISCQSRFFFAGSQCKEDREACCEGACRWLKHGLIPGGQSLARPWAAKAVLDWGP